MHLTNNISQINFFGRFMILELKFSSGYLPILLGYKLNHPDNIVFPSGCQFSFKSPKMFRV